MTRCRKNYRAAFVATVFLFAYSVYGQTEAEKKQLDKTTSLGDAIRAMAAPLPVAETIDLTAASPRKKPTSKAPAHKRPPAADSLPLHVVYIHGINQIGEGDSVLLRKAMCQKLKVCLESAENPPAVYAQGPFAVGTTPPTLSFMGHAIWGSSEEWSASAPFYKRYVLSNHGASKVILDEINWWSLVYPVKCKFMIPGDSKLAGPSKNTDNACIPIAPSPYPLPGVADTSPGNTGRFVSYRWPAPDGVYGDLPLQKATVINRALKNGLMDWGFGDAAMALGPMREILCAGIRQLLLQATSSPQTAVGPNTGGQIFFITHSLGSYLSMAAMDPDALGIPSPSLSAFAVTKEQTDMTKDVLKHTTGFYFLANQIALLEVAQFWDGMGAKGKPDPACAANGQTNSAAAPKSTFAAAVQHYVCVRGSDPTAGELSPPQIIAWSAADDLLSWYVPEITGVTVVNLHAKNKGFRIPKLVANPVSVHGNYAENPLVLKEMFR